MKLTYFISGMLVTALLSCVKESVQVETPFVKTIQISQVTIESAICEVEIVNDGGSQITEKGICWSLTNPITALDEFGFVGGYQKVPLRIDNQ